MSRERILRTSLHRIIPIPLRAITDLGNKNPNRIHTTFFYQAMRRIWRPFAPLPVEIYFPVYSNTAEEMILDLVGEKMLSNQLLTGQEVGGALVPDDAGNILQVAVNRLLKGVRPKQVQGIFAAQNTMTASPLGSPTAESPEVTPFMTLDEWKVRHSQTLQKRVRRSKMVVSSSQIALPL